MAAPLPHSDSPDWQLSDLNDEWRTRGIDPATIQLRNGTAVFRETVPARDVRETLQGLPPLLSPTFGNNAPFAFTGVLGEGGMGVVRLAVQSALDREVAVKTLKDEIELDTAAPTLLREARVTGALEHPHVPPVYALGRDEEDRPLIVMKRIEGTSWTSMIDAAEDRTSDEYLTQHLGILRHVTMAVIFAHEKGVLHRDIKPDNVMVGAFGEVYLVDWGIACKLREGGIRGLPLARDIKYIEGTPSYIAPEMAVGSGTDFDERSDVFLLGATLHEVLVGEPPHTGSTITTVLSKAFVSKPHDYPPHVPRALAEICHRAMARFTGARYPSARAFLEALDLFLEHRAAMRMADEAERRLGELDEACGRGSGGDGAQQAHTLFTELRFAFQHSLRSWRNNAVARRGLQRALETMIAFELKSGAADAAATYARELPDPNPELQAQVDQAVAKKKSAEARLTQLERDRDLSIGERERQKLTRSLSVLWLVTCVAIWLVALLGLVDVDVRAMAAGRDAIFAAAIFVGRLVFKQLGTTQANRWLMFLSGAGFATFACVWLLALKLGISVGGGVALVSLMSVALWTCLAATVDRNWIILVIANVLSGVTALMFPLYAMLLLGLIGGGGSMIASFRCLPDKRAE
jgi:serine/threonine-protein kinase